MGYSRRIRINLARRRVADPPMKSPCYLAPRKTIYIIIVYMYVCVCIPGVAHRSCFESRDRTVMMSE